MNLSIPYTQNWYVNKIQKYISDLQKSGKKFKTVRDEVCDLLSTKPFYKFPKDKVLVFKNNNKKQFSSDINSQWTIVVKLGKQKELRSDKYYYTDNSVKYDTRVRIFA